MFERARHRRIARLLECLNAELLRANHCWFGGGTAIALRCNEFRESADVDFLVSELQGYRDLRQRMRGARDLAPLLRAGAPQFVLEREARVDQYGIRAFVVVNTEPVKFEIVNEGRIVLDTPARRDVLCGIATLSLTDLAASKLLANSDRWADESIFARDAIDLAMLDLPPRRLATALDKAMAAYGTAVVDDMHAALHQLRERPAWLQHCMRALSIHMPAAAMQENLRRSARRLAAAAEHLDQR